MGKKYKVESDFEDLRGNPDDDQELEVDLSDSENPIIRAAIDGDDDNWQKPDGEDEGDEELEKDDGEELDEDDEEADDDEESDEDDDGGQDDDEEESDDQRYSKKVQKRIDRERRLRQEAEDAANRKLAKMEKRLAVRDAKDDFRDEERKLEAKMVTLREKKAAAIEEGDTSAQVTIDEEILDIRSEIRVGKQKIEALEKDLENDTDDSAGGSTPPVGQRWLRKYPEFHSNPRFRDSVLRADRMVADMGLDKNTEKYYSKIEEIVAIAYPEIVKTRRAKIKQKGKTNKGKRKQPAVGGTGRAGTGRPTTKKSRGGTIRLTKQDQTNMRVFGMDPGNAEHVKAWAESKE